MVTAKHILQRCTERELHEELGLNAPVSPVPIGVVVDLETASSRRHFGVVFECPISDTVISVRRECDNSEFTRSRYNNDYPLLKSCELINKKFDPWSQLLLTSGFARRNFGTPSSAFALQLPLGTANELKYLRADFPSHDLLGPGEKSCFLLRTS